MNHGSEKNPGECCCCGHTTTKLHNFNNQPPFDRDDWHWHCDVCYGTFAGRNCTSPNLYPGVVLPTIAACTNMILDAIKNTTKETP